MLLKTTAILLAFFLAISLTVNYLLIKRQNFSISFENEPSQTPIPTDATIPTTTPTNSVKPVMTGAEIGKTFSIPLTDSQGNNVEEAAYTLTSYKITDEVVVAGRLATAIEGRAFLIIDIQITNPLDRAIEINTKDYVRLSVNNNSEEWLSADIHNDPTKVEPISSKFTLLGFPINDTDTDLTLRFGELNGSKETIKLHY